MAKPARISGRGARAGTIEPTARCAFPRWIRAAALASFLSAAAAAEPSLVLDINQAGAGSMPLELTAVGTTIFFTHEDLVSGRELWKSDGTAAGTVRVKDICPGYRGSDPTQLTAAGNRLFFTCTCASEESSSLWTSDGTSEGTRQVSDQIYGAHAITRFGNRVVFLANANWWFSIELWASDGTSDGTKRLYELSNEPSFALLGDFAVAGDRFFFRGNDGEQGIELWVSDGTAEGTRVVKDLVPGSDSGYPERLMAAGNRVFFRAHDPEHGWELWSSDGTPEGTSMVKDITPGSDQRPGRALPYPLGALDNLLLFVADDGTHGAELWASDGTSDGTSMLGDLWPGADAGLQATPEAAVFAGRLFFAANDGVQGRELWTSDGTPEGTVPFLDARSGPYGSGPSSWTAAGNLLYFTAYDDAHGGELWSTDGSTAGTRVVKDVRPGGADSSCARLTAMGASLCFVADDGIVGDELWTTDGTAEGTRLVADLTTATESAHPERLTAAGGRVFFAANDGAGEPGLWTSDGTPAGTHILRAGVTIPGATPPAVFGSCAAVADRFFFAAHESEHGEELWLSDGTPAGTALLEDIIPGPDSSRPKCCVAFHGRLFFETSGDLWTSDGTAEGTRLFYAFWTANPDAAAREIVPGIDRLYVFLETWSKERSLWVTDGTPEGMRQVRDLGVDSGRSPIAVRDRLFFLAGAQSDQTLWASDGTAAGTVAICARAPEAASWFIQDLAAFGGRLSFTAGESEDDRRLWMSDGTPAGTAPLRGFATEPRFVSNAARRALASAGARLFFFAYGDESIESLWASDGTAAGTARIAPFRGTVLAAGGGRLFFTRDDYVNGEELWTSDGTAEGTRLVSDLYPGPTGAFEAGSSRAQPLAAFARDRLFFAADDGIHGFELFALPVGPETRFRRGDANVDGKVNIADSVLVLSFLFSQGALRGCAAAADANDDATINIADAIAILTHLFGGGGLSLPEPFGACGTYPSSPDYSLPCDRFPPCR